MSKLIVFLSAAVVAFGMTSPASADVPTDLVMAMQRAAQLEAITGLPWKVGDKASYKLTIGFINGTIDSFVREDVGDALWMQQDANLGFLGKQKVEVLFNKADGRVLKMLVNGEEQQPPAAGDIEVIEMKEDKVHVPAGDFDCIYVKVKDKKSGQVQEAWVNPKAVPMSGTLKATGDTQLGKMVQELTSFQFAN